MMMSNILKLKLQHNHKYICHSHRIDTYHTLVSDQILGQPIEELEVRGKCQLP
jgi:hypothetical protein